MRSLADLEDYEARHGAVGGEGDTIKTLLEDVSGLVLEAVEGSTKEWVTADDNADPEVPRAVIYVCVSAVHRQIEHGDGIVREQLGAHSVTYNANAPTSLELTKQEKRIVRKAAGLTSALTVELVSPFSCDRPVGSDLDFSFPLEDEGAP